jgi:hypothetical protein
MLAYVQSVVDPPLPHESFVFLRPPKSDSSTHTAQKCEIAHPYNEITSDMPVQELTGLRGFDNALGVGFPLLVCPVVFSEANNFRSVRGSCSSNV